MKKISFFLFLLFSTFSVYSQGCSDAGFCTIENFQVQSVDSLNHKNAFKIGANFGAADNDIIVFGSYLEYQRTISKVVDLDLKINYLSQSANGFSSSALSDAFLISNFRLNKTSKVSLGLKIPFNDGNLKDNGFALPLDFQPSLGTLDLIIGASKRFDRWNFALALQQPLTQNKNEFIAPAGSDFFSTNKYIRAGDLLLRASYLFEINDKLTLSPSILPIYHLAEDKFTDTDGIEKNIDDSSGLTVNLNAYLNYKLNKVSGLEFSLGFPTIVRKSRPDGLTRGLVANLEYKIKF